MTTFVSSTLCPQPCPPGESQVDTGDSTSIPVLATPISITPSSFQPSATTPNGPDSSLLPKATPTNGQPGKNLSLTHSLISIIVAVGVIFCAISGCVMLACTYIIHCRKRSKVDQLASRRTVLEIGKELRFVKRQ
jgi:hypothetical protein